MSKLNWFKASSKDTGSLNVGSYPVEIGDQLFIDGDAKSPRTVTSVMGTAAKGNLHAVCKGTGVFPTGEEIKFMIIPKGSKVPMTLAQVGGTSQGTGLTRAQLEAMIAKMDEEEDDAANEKATA